MSRLNWSYFLFLFSTIVGTLISLSASNWISLYIGIELNLFAFIPLALKSPNNKSYEAVIKYFLAQTLGSLLFLATTIWLNISPHTTLPSTLLPLRLIVKAGAGPLHFWFPNVISGFNWHLCLLLITWQKLFPLLFIFHSLTTPSTYLLTILYIAGTLSGALGGLNQTSLRGILAYSSISHTGWILTVSTFSPICATIYLFIYILTSLTLILTLAPWFNIDSSKLTSLISFPTIHKSILLLLFLSQAGLPPFLGFLPKWQIIDQLTLFSPWAVIPLLLASILTLFFYLKITLFISLTPNTPWPTPLMAPLFTTLTTLILLNLPLTTLLLLP